MKRLLSFLVVLGTATAAISQTMNHAEREAPSPVARDFPVAAARAQSSGEAVFLARCQYCHVQMGYGTLTLMKRLGPQQALLADRTDLTADYVRAVVRNGLNGMPPITPVEVSEVELNDIVTYLTRTRPASTKK